MQPPTEDGCTYGIDCLKLVEPVNDSESDSKLLLEKRREGQAANVFIRIIVLNVNVTY